MTREEAIRILDPQTTGEALEEIEYYNGFSGKTAAVQAVSDACVLAVSALREQEERNNPKPLTMDELRQMGGKPVYIHSDIFSGDCGWRVVKATEVLYIQFTDGDYFHFTDYGMAWIAYRSKPKEE